MEIIISDTKKICEIQEAFNNQFPHLKLEFFEYRRGQKSDFSKKNMLKDNNVNIGEIREFYQPSTISFNGNQKVNTLETNFREQHGLYVQVFRWNGKNWLETSNTDDRTLATQNKEAIAGKELKQESDARDFDAYHEQT